MVAVGGAPLLLAVIIGFIVGFVWMLRRSVKRGGARANRRIKATDR